MDETDNSQSMLSEYQRGEKQTDVHTESCTNKGCSYSANTRSPSLKEKHERWMCGYKETNCGKCDKSHKNMTLIEHYVKEHCTLVKTNMIANENVGMCKINRGGTFHAFKIDNVLFRLEIYFTQLSMVLWMVCDSEIPEDYKCSYEIIFPKENAVRGEMTNKNNPLYDWSQDIQLGNCGFNKIPEKGDVIIRISKNNNVFD